MNKSHRCVCVLAEVNGDPLPPRRRDPPTPAPRTVPGRLTNQRMLVVSNSSRLIGPCWTPRELARGLFRAAVFRNQLTSSGSFCQNWAKKKTAIRVLEKVPEES